MLEAGAARWLRTVSPGTWRQAHPVGELTEADYNNIDCLLCHAPGYKRTVGQGGDKFRIAPDPSIDVLKAAQSVQKPTNDMCLRCHMGAGAGRTHSTGVTPTKDATSTLRRDAVPRFAHIARKHKVAAGPTSSQDSSMSGRL